MKDYIDFEEEFNLLIEKHKSDKDYVLLKDYPLIFSTVMSIASERNSDGITKALMNAAISYFVLPTYSVPEKNSGIKGYIDDFFICIYALRELLEHDKKMGEYLIKKYWKIQENYDDYIPKKYYELLRKIDSETVADITSSSGLEFITNLIRSKKNPRTYSEQRIHDLQRKMYYLFFLFFNRPLIGKEEKRKFENEFFGGEDFREFTKKIELLSKSDSQFSVTKDNVDDMFDLEKRIKKIRAERLLR